MRRIKKLFFRCLALNLAMTLTGMGILPLPARAQIMPMPIQAHLPEDLSQFRLPPVLGKIDELKSGRDGRVIILIQDAHAIPDAQSSIQKTIAYLQEAYGIRHVAVEGTSNRLDTTLFKSFPDKVVLKKLFKEYFDRGELTGTSAAALFNPGHEIYEGVEDWRVYEQGLALYLSALDNQPGLLDFLSSKKSKLETAKQRVYSKALLKADMLISRFFLDKSDLVSTLKGLAEFEQPPQNSDLALMLNEAQSDGRDQSQIEIEVKKAAKEVKAQAEGLTAKITSDDLKEFNNKLQEFQIGQVTAKSFAAFLKKFSAQHGLTMRFSKALQFSANNQVRLEQVEGTRFFREFKVYVTGIKEHLFETEEQRAVDHEGEQVALLERLALMKLDQEDWQKVSSGALSIENNAFRDALLPAVAFYQNAKKRDELLFRNLIKQMDKAKTNAGIIVAGGFHTEGLAHHFSEAGTSFVVIMPGIRDLPEESHYVDQMRGQVSWQEALKVEDGKIDLYGAFARYTRDRLLGRVDGGKLKIEGRAVGDAESAIRDPNLLKNWRDQILRDLAAQGRLEQAAQYTRFLDEVVDSKSGTDDFKTAWLKNTDKFMGQIKELKSANQLNQANVAQLFAPSGIPSAQTAGQFVPNVYLPVASKLSTGNYPEARQLLSVQTAKSEVRSSQMALEISEEIGRLAYAINSDGSKVYLELEDVRAAFEADPSRAVSVISPDSIVAHVEKEGLLWELTFEKQPEGDGLVSISLNVGGEQSSPRLDLKLNRDIATPEGEKVEALKQILAEYSIAASREPSIGEQSRALAEEKAQITADIANAYNLLDETFFKDLSDLQLIIKEDKNFDLEDPRNSRYAELADFFQRLSLVIQQQTGIHLTLKSLSKVHAGVLVHRADGNSKSVYEIPLILPADDEGGLSTVTLSVAVKRAREGSRITYREVEKGLRVDRSTGYDGSVTPVTIQIYRSPSDPDQVSVIIQNFIHGETAYHAVRGNAAYPRFTLAELRNIAATWTRAGRYSTEGGDSEAFPTDLNPGNIMYRNVGRELDDPDPQFNVVDFGTPEAKTTQPHLFIHSLAKNYIRATYNKTHTPVGGFEEGPALEALLDGVGRRGFASDPARGVLFLMTAVRGGAEKNYWINDPGLKQAILNEIAEMLRHIYFTANHEAWKQLMTDHELDDFIREFFKDGDSFLEDFNLIKDEMTTARSEVRSQVSSIDQASFDLETPFDVASFLSRYTKQDTSQLLAVFGDLLLNDALGVAFLDRLIRSAKKPLNAARLADYADLIVGARENDGLLHYDSGIVPYALLEEGFLKWVLGNQIPYSKLNMAYELFRINETKKPTEGKLSSDKLTSELMKQETIKGRRTFSEDVWHSLAPASVLIDRPIVNPHSETLLNAIRQLGLDPQKVEFRADSDESGEVITIEILSKDRDFITNAVTNRLSLMSQAIRPLNRKGQALLTPRNLNLEDVVPERASVPIGFVMASQSEAGAYVGIIQPYLRVGRDEYPEVYGFVEAHMKTLVRALLEEPREFFKAPGAASRVYFSTPSTQLAFKKRELSPSTAIHYYYVLLQSLGLEAFPLESPLRLAGQRTAYTAWALPPSSYLRVEASARRSEVRIKEGTVEFFLKQKLEEVALENSAFNLAFKPQDFQGEGMEMPRGLTEKQLEGLYAIAVKHHKGQTRKDAAKTNYMAHVLGVVAILVNRLGVGDPQTIAAAFLHDTLEDSIEYFENSDRNNEKRTALRDQIQASIERDLADLDLAKDVSEIMEKVNAMTKKDGIDLVGEYFPGLLDVPLGAELKVADRLYNLSDLKHSDKTDFAYNYILGEATGTLHEFIEAPMPSNEKGFIFSLEPIVQYTFKRQVLQALLDNYNKGESNKVNVEFNNNGLFVQQIINRIDSNIPKDETGTPDLLLKKAIDFIGSEIARLPSVRSEVRSSEFDRGQAIFPMTNLPGFSNEEARDAVYKASDIILGLSREQEGKGTIVSLEVIREKILATYQNAAVRDKAADVFTTKKIKDLIEVMQTRLKGVSFKFIESQGKDSVLITTAALTQDFASVDAFINENNGNPVVFIGGPSNLVDDYSAALPLIQSLLGQIKTADPKSVIVVGTSGFGHAHLIVQEARRLGLKVVSAIPSQHKVWAGDADGYIQAGTSWDHQDYYEAVGRFSTAIFTIDGNKATGREYAAVGNNSESQAYSLDSTNAPSSELLNAVVQIALSKDKSFEPLQGETLRTLQLVSQKKGNKDLTALERQVRRAFAQFENLKALRDAQQALLDSLNAASGDFFQQALGQGISKFALAAVIAALNSESYTHLLTAENPENAREQVVFELMRSVYMSRRLDAPPGYGFDASLTSKTFDLGSNGVSLEVIQEKAAEVTEILLFLKANPIALFPALNESLDKAFREQGLGDLLKQMNQGAEKISDMIQENKISKEVLKATEIPKLANEFIHFLGEDEGESAMNKIGEDRLQAAHDVYQTLKLLRDSNAAAMTVFINENPEVMQKLINAMHDAWLRDELNPRNPDERSYEAVEYTPALHALILEQVTANRVTFDGGKTFLTPEDFKKPGLKFKLRAENFHFSNNVVIEKEFLDQFKEATGRDLRQTTKPIQVNTIAAQREVLLNLITEPNARTERVEFLDGLQKASVSAVVGALSNPETIQGLQSSVSEKQENAIVSLGSAISYNFRFYNPDYGANNYLAAKPISSATVDASVLENLRKDIGSAKSVLAILHQETGVKLPAGLKEAIDSAYSNGLGETLNRLNDDSDALKSAVEKNPEIRDFIREALLAVPEAEAPRSEVRTGVGNQEQQRLEKIDGILNSIDEHGVLSTAEGQRRGIPAFFRGADKQVTGSAPKALAVFVEMKGRDALMPKIEKSATLTEEEEILYFVSDEDAPLPELAPQLYFESDSAFERNLSDWVSRLLGGSDETRSPRIIAGERDYTDLNKELALHGKEIIEDRLRNSAMVLMRSDESVKDWSKKGPEVEVPGSVFGFDSFNPELIAAIFVPRQIYDALNQLGLGNSKLLPVDGMHANKVYGVEHPDWDTPIKNFIGTQLSGAADTPTYMLHSVRLPAGSDGTAKSEVRHAADVQPKDLLTQAQVSNLDSHEIAQIAFGLLPRQYGILLPQEALSPADAAAAVLKGLAAANGDDALRAQITKFIDLIADPATLAATAEAEEKALIASLERVIKDRTYTIGAILPTEQNQMSPEFITAMVKTLKNRDEIDRVVTTGKGTPMSGFMKALRGIITISQVSATRKPSTASDEQTKVPMIFGADEDLILQIYQTLNDSFLPISSNSSAEETPFIREYVEVLKVAAAIHTADLLSHDKKLLSNPADLKQKLFERLFLAENQFVNMLKVSGNKIGIDSTIARVYLTWKAAEAAAQAA